MYQNTIEQAILDLFTKLYCAEYASKLRIQELKDRDEVIGYSLELSLNNTDKPLYISAEGTIDQFLVIVENELRTRRLDRVDFYSGYQVDLDEINNTKKCQETNKL